MPFVAKLPVDKEVVFETLSSTTLEDAQVEDLEQETAELKKQVDYLKFRIKVNESEHNELIKKTAAEQEGLKDKIKNLTREGEKLLKKLEKLTEKVNKSETKLNNLSDENLRLGKEVDKKSARIHTLKRSEIDLQEKIAQYKKR